MGDILKLVLSYRREIGLFFDNFSDILFLLICLFIVCVETIWLWLRAKKKVIATGSQTKILEPPESDGSESDDSERDEGMLMMERVLLACDAETRTDELQLATETPTDETQLAQSDDVTTKPLIASTFASTGTQTDEPCTTTEDENVAEDCKSRPTVLTGPENYAQWSKETRSRLEMGKGLWEATAGHNSRPVVQGQQEINGVIVKQTNSAAALLLRRESTLTEDEERLKIWYTYDRAALAIILANIDDRFAPSLYVRRQAKDLWDYLRQQYCTHPQAARVADFLTRYRSFQNFFHLRLNGCNNNLDAFTNTFLKLKDVFEHTWKGGVVLDEDILCAAFLDGLKGAGTFDSFVQRELRRPTKQKPRRLDILMADVHAFYKSKLPASSRPVPNLAIGSLEISMDGGHDLEHRPSASRHSLAPCSLIQHHGFNHSNTKCPDQCVAEGINVNSPTSAHVALSRPVGLQNKGIPSDKRAAWQQFSTTNHQRVGPSVQAKSSQSKLEEHPSMSPVSEKSIESSHEIAKVTELFR